MLQFTVLFDMIHAEVVKEVSGVQVSCVVPVCGIICKVMFFFFFFNLEVSECSALYLFCVSVCDTKLHSNDGKFFCDNMKQKNVHL